jgi:mono/diheme cytochrome c family protein
MRHIQIARLTWVLTGLFAACAVAFAATRPAPEAASEGVSDPSAAAAAFEAHCAACHGQGDFPGWAARRPDPAERRAWLDDFLQRHYPPPADERALVIDHIERSIAEGR